MDYGDAQLIFSVRGLPDQRTVHDGRHFAHIDEGHQRPSPVEEESDTKGINGRSPSRDVHTLTPPKGKRTRASRCPAQSRPARVRSSTARGGHFGNFISAVPHRKPSPTLNADILVGPYSAAPLPPGQHLVTAWAIPLPYTSQPGPSATKDAAETLERNGRGT